MPIDFEGIQKTCKEFEKKHGKGSIFTLGNQSNLIIPRWSTGIAELDDITGGGFPEGRITEISGDEGSGKTSLAYHLASMHKIAAYIPVEGTYDEERAKAIGVKKKRMIVARAEYGEQALNLSLKLIKSGTPLIIIDSVPACVPKEELEKTKNNCEDENRIGGVARLFSKTLPIFVHECEKSGSHLLLINQRRDKMNAPMFGEKDDTPGGRAIKFYSSIRIKTARRSWIEIPNKNPKNTAVNEKVGIIMKLKVIKSKVCNPFGEAEIPFFFDRGFVPFDDIKEIRKELMRLRRED